MPDLATGAAPELTALPPPPAALTGEHPRLVALRQELAAARLSRQVAQRIVAWPELIGGWKRQESAAGSLEGPIVGLSWPLPLLDRKRAEKATATARENAAAARLEVAESRLDAARGGAQSAYERLELAARDARGAAAGNTALVAAAVAAFEQGESSLTDLLETLRSVAEAELAALDLHAVALAAFYRLEEQTGQPLDAPSASASTETIGVNR